MTTWLATVKDKVLHELFKLNIKRRLTTSFIFGFVLPILLIGGYNATHSFLRNRQATQVYLEESSEQIVDNITYYILYNIDLLNQVAGNANVIEGLKKYETAPWDDKRVIENQIRMTLSNTFGINSAIKAGEIVTLDRSYFYYQAPISNGDFTTSRLLHTDTRDISIQIGKKEVLSDRKSYLIMSKGIFIEEDVCISNIVAAVDLSYLNEACLNNVTDLRNEILIVNNLDIVVSASNEDAIGSLYYQDLDSAVSVSTTIPNTDLKIINRIPLQRLYRFAFIQLFIALFIALIFAGLSYMIANALTKSITNPIYSLVAEMNQDTIEKHVDDLGNDEYHEVIEGFNKMSGKVVDAISRGYQLRLEHMELNERQKEAELSALQQQINPHFLYNTLESIYWSCQMEGDEEISAIINAVGSYLRAIIDNGLEYVTLSDEIDSIKNYIFLQNIRFGDRVQVTWNVLDRLLSCKIAKLAIHPIIEDVIAANLDEVMGTVELEISIILDQDTIVAAVGGQGVAHFFSYCDDMVESMKGINSVDERIKLYYGNEFGVDPYKDNHRIMITMPNLSDEGEEVSYG